MSDTWGGTPAARNEDIAVNHSLKRAVKQGYTYPLLGHGVVAVINVSKRGFVDSNIVLRTTEVRLYALSQVKRCTYTVTPGWWSRRTEVSCNNANSAETQVTSRSPRGKWLSIYF